MINISTKAIKDLAKTIEAFGKELILDGGYICRECAESYKDSWPEGHAATCHEGECLMCEEVTAVCHTTDWDFPLRKKLRPMEREV